MSYQLKNRVLIIQRQSEERFCPRCKKWFTYEPSTNILFMAEDEEICCLECQRRNLMWHLKVRNIYRKNMKEVLLTA